MYALLLSYTYIRPECTDTEKYKESGALVLRLLWLRVVLELGEVKTCTVLLLVVVLVLLLLVLLLLVLLLEGVLFCLDWLHAEHLK